MRRPAAETITAGGRAGNGSRDDAPITAEISLNGSE